MDSRTVNQINVNFELTNVHIQALELQLSSVVNVLTEEHDLALKNCLQAVSNPSRIVGEGRQGRSLSALTGNVEGDSTKYYF